MFITWHLIDFPLKLISKLAGDRLDFFTKCFNAASISIRELMKMSKCARTQVTVKQSLTFMVILTLYVQR